MVRAEWVDGWESGALSKTLGQKKMVSPSMWQPASPFSISIRAYEYFALQFEGTSSISELNLIYICVLSSTFTFTFMQYKCTTL